MDERNPLEIRSEMGASCEAETIIETDGLSRNFGKKAAVKSVNLHIRRGEIYGLIGRNGAGKTTVLKMIAGLIQPTNGSITLFGKDLGTALSDGTAAKVGVLIENPGLYGSMTGIENLKMKCLCAGIENAEPYIAGLLHVVGLTDAGNKKVGGYSLGMKQRLGIAMALVGDPEILILDEPINGLDPQGIMEVREILLALHKQRSVTILISSHILEELAKMVTTVGIIDNGVLLREFSREEMEEECKGGVCIETPEPEKALEALKNAGVPVTRVYTTGKTLEEFYMEIAGGETK